MRIAGIVVYNPEIERLKKNIDAVIEQVDCLLIYCNSDFEKTMFSDYSKIKYINDGTNNGISHALNEIMSEAENEGAEWCLLLDQDSIVSDNIMDKYEKYICDELVAILTPNIVDEKAQGFICKNDVSLIEMCITSGSYNKIDVWKSVGGFNEDFFIDYVDWEYCARIRKQGYKIYLIGETVLNHQLGDVSYYSFGKYKISTFNHSAFRKYYITRNSIVTYKLYPYEQKLKHPYLRVLKRFMIVVLFEEDKLNKCLSIMRGLRDVGRLYKKLSEENADVVTIV